MAWCGVGWGGVGGVGWGGVGWGGVVFFHVQVYLSDVVSLHCPGWVSCFCDVERNEESSTSVRERVSRGNCTSAFYYNFG